MATIQIDSSEYELLMKQHKRMREALEYIEKQDPFIDAEDSISKMQDLTLKAGYALSDVINWEQEKSEIKMESNSISQNIFVNRTEDGKQITSDKSLLALDAIRKSIKNGFNGGGLL